MQIYRQRASENQSKTELGIAKISDASIENQPMEKELIVATADNKLRTNTPSMYASSVFRVSSNGLRPNRRKADRNFDGVSETTVGFIEEAQVVNLTDNGFRVFSVEDSEISSFSKGKYRYTAELQILDPSISYLNEKLAEICSVKDLLSDLSSDITNMNAYDSVNKRFKDRYQVRNGRKHNSTI